MKTPFKSLHAAIVGPSVLLLLLSACATQTPYKPAEKDEPYGYTETKLTSDRYRIVFTGNSSTKADTTRDFALLRASELTLQNGDDWFQVVDQSTDKKTQATGYAAGPEVIPVQNVYQRCGMLRCQSVVTTTPVITGGGAGGATVSNSYSSEIQIVIGKNPMPQNTETYDAHQTATSLRRMLIKQ